MLLPDEIIVIGSWSDGDEKSLRIQNFVVDGETFIPIFSDEPTFRQLTLGSGYEASGVGVDRMFLARLLRGDELLVLNPGSATSCRLRATDLRN